MTRANVGSLLVFDPEKLDLTPPQADKLKEASGDAVVGIITERGAGAALCDLCTAPGVRLP